MTARTGDGLKLAGALVMGVLSRRPVRPSAEEYGRRLPGDELVPNAGLRWTHGITIRARPPEIWPWLAQMGCRRAGWYSYDGLDNGGRPSEERIVPELQGVEVGDIFPMSPTADDGFVVRAVEPEKDLILGDPSGSATWAFVLVPVDDATTRVITRVRAGFDRFALGLLFALLWRPIHFGMQRRQLLNLKRLVEGAA